MLVDQIIQILGYYEVVKFVLGQQYGGQCRNKPEIYEVKK